jgi:hypothetical protein
VQVSVDDRRRTNAACPCYSRRNIPLPLPGCRSLASFRVARRDDPTRSRSPIDAVARRFAPTRSRTMSVSVAVTLRTRSGTAQPACTPPSDPAMLGKSSPCTTIRYCPPAYFTRWHHLLLFSFERMGKSIVIALVGVTDAPTFWRRCRRPRR